MQITQTFYPKTRKDWRAWLEKHHASKKEIWLICPHKDSGLPQIPYGDMVREAICFGWIDGTVRTFNAQCSCRRWTPRTPKSVWSELNKHHARLAIAKGLMTPAGQAVLPDLDPGKFRAPPALLKRLKQDPVLWQNFCALPDYYKRIRLDYIVRRGDRPDLYEKTLAYFMRQTRAGKRYGPFKNDPEIY